MLSALHVLTDLVLPKPNEVSTILIIILQIRKMKHRVYTADGEELGYKPRQRASIIHALLHYTQRSTTLYQNYC